LKKSGDRVCLVAAATSERVVQVCAYSVCMEHWYNSDWQTKPKCQETNTFSHNYLPQIPHWPRSNHTYSSSAKSWQIATYTAARPVIITVHCQIIAMKY